MNTLTTYLPGDPARHAAEILQAWRGNDLVRLSANLASAAAIEPSDDPNECEQAELLSSIAADLQDMLASGRTAGAAVCLNLLRHLACQSRTAFYTN
jgi:hypothetical protein